MGSVPAGALGGTVALAGSLPEKLQQLDDCKATGNGLQQGGDIGETHSGSRA